MIFRFYAKQLGVEKFSHQDKWFNFAVDSPNELLARDTAHQHFSGIFENDFLLYLIDKTQPTAKSSTQNA